MKCRCCDVTLTDYETSVKGKLSDTYLDTCVACLKKAEIDYYGNAQLEGGDDGEVCSTDSLPELWEQ